MQKKFFIFPILFLLLILIIYSATVIDVNLKTNHRKPTITVPFTEYACVWQSRVINSSGEIISTSSYPNGESTLANYPYTCPTSGDNKHYKIWKFNVTQALPNGNYKLYFLATDVVNNSKEYEVLFEVNGSIGINLTAPRFGYSPTKSTNVTIKTEENSNCRYGQTNVDYDNMRDFTTTGGIEHNLLNYELPISSPGTSVFYVGCKDEFDFKNYKSFDLIWDATAPTLNLEADPQIISDENRRTTLKAKSDDEVVCKYSQSTNNYAQMTYFDNNDENNVLSYKSEQQQNFSYPGVDYGTYFYYVTCKNKATLTTTKNITITVNMSLPMTITVLSPPRYTSEQNINITIQTSKTATCKLNLTGNPNMASENGRLHNYSLGNLATGNYSYKATCIPNIGNEVSEIIDFIVDRTAPSSFVINSPNGTCNNILSADFIANDTESGIGLYNYSVLEISGTSSNIIVQWKTTTEPRATETLNLNTSKTYKFQGYAQNRAGLWSALATGNSIAVYNQTDVRCDLIPPIVQILENQTTLGKEVKIICSDASGCAFIKYGVANASALCNISTTSSGTNLTLVIPPSSEYGVGSLFTKSFWLCYNVSDVAGNYINASKFIIANITLANHCSNNLTDADETDVDCGGRDCLPCLIGENCTNSSDCQTQYCDNITHTCQYNPNCTLSTCGPPLCPNCPGTSCLTNTSCSTGFCNLTSGQCEYLPSCYNGIRDGSETDVDCGGNCPACLGGGCTNNNQCQSGYCNSQGQCAVPTCTDGVKNGNETGIDCGGNVCPKCENNQGCLNNSDCVSGFCQNGRCITNPNQDTDGDGIPDYWEEQYCGTATCMDPNEDLDGDGLTNLEEFRKGTNPLKKDTDGDGYSDGQEVKAGTDPLDPLSHPKASILKTILLLLGALSTLGGGGYYAYKKFKPEEQIARPAIKLEKPPTFSIEEQARKQKLIEEKLKKSKEEKESARRRLMELFAGKEEKPSSKLIEIQRKGLTKEETTQPKEAVEQVKIPEAIPKEVGIEKETIFDKLENLLSQKEVSALPKEASKQDVFEALKKISGEKKHEDAIQKLSEIAKSTNTKKQIINDLIKTSENHPIKKDMLTLTLRHLIERQKINIDDVKDILDSLVDKNLVSKVDATSILFEIKK